MMIKFRLDWIIVSVSLLLVTLGIVVIYTITFPNVRFDLARSQIFYAILGTLVALVMVRINYSHWQGLSWLFYIFGLVLLVSVLMIGSSQFGASRWLDLGLFQFQPSEIFKLILVLILARYLSDWSGAFTPLRLLAVLGLAGLPIFLTFAQPDLGTASVLSVITISMMLFAKIPGRWWLVLFGLTLLLLPLSYTQLRSYQKDRLQTFFRPETDPAGKGYNVRQAAIAIGSGGLMGLGLGKGTQSQLNFLPVAHTDFIFAGLAEATGLIGAVVLLFLYFGLVARAFKIAELSKDSYGMFVALGIAIMFAFQVVVNVGMNLAVVPVTGIPLPFVSFGGTSLIVSLASIGLLQSIYLRHKRINF